MTKLEAVNFVLMSNGHLPVPALDTTGASEATMAEKLIDQEDEIGQARMWLYNEEIDRELATAQAARSPGITLSGAAWDNTLNTITQTGAFANYSWLANDRIKLSSASAGFTDQWFRVASRDSADQITLDDTDGRPPDAGYAFSNQTDISGGQIGWEIPLPTGTIEIDAYGMDSWRDLTQRGGYIYDRENHTFVFTSTLRTRYVIRENWGCIPPDIQHYIAACATEKYHRLRRRPMDLYQRIMLQKMDMKVKAEQFNSRVARVDMLDTPQARRLRGGRPRVLDGYGADQGW